MSVTKIEWTDRTWNPVTGCTKVSPGCDNCYAETIAHRFAGQPAFPDGFAVTMRPTKLDEPLHWGRPSRVFVNSMSDLFHDAVPRSFLLDVFAVMALAPKHTFQILTKRHGRMRSTLSDPRFWVEVGHQARRLGYSHALPEQFLADGQNVYDVNAWTTRRSLPNVWLGVSVEDQQRADLRIPALLDTPAVVRFLSCEPLLGPVDLLQAVVPMGSERGHGLTASYVHVGGCCEKFHGIDWVIVGGESGRAARPMHPAWARRLRDQCTSAGVPFFFKQWGEWGPAPWTVRVCDPAAGWSGTDAELTTAKRAAEERGATHCVMPDGHLYQPNYKSWSLERVGDEDGAVRRWGKKAAGRELDGRTWNEFPTPAVVSR